MEVFTIDEVSGQSVSSPGGVVELKPLYSTGRIPNDEYHLHRPVFWHHQRRPSGRKDDEGTEVFLSFTDLDFKPADPAAERLTVRVTCTNRDLPARIPFGSPAGDFHMKITGPVARIKCILPPTPVRRPSPEGARQWLLLSHLSPNHLTLTEGGEEALREILLLYDLDNSPVTRRQISGIVSVKSRHVTKRVEQSFRRGVEIAMDFDEEHFEGGGLFLFASVLERFVARYVSASSFIQLVASTTRRREPMKKWAPRIGTRPLL